MLVKLSDLKSIKPQSCAYENGLTAELVFADVPKTSPKKSMTVTSRARQRSLLRYEASHATRKTLNAGEAGRHRHLHGVSCSYTSASVACETFVNESPQVRKRAKVFEKIYSHFFVARWLSR